MITLERAVSRAVVEMELVRDRTAPELEFEDWLCGVESTVTCLTHGAYVSLDDVEGWDTRENEEQYRAIWEQGETPWDAAHTILFAIEYFVF